MTEVFKTLGVTVDRKLHEFADSSHQAFDRFKKKSLNELYENTRDWTRHNTGKAVVGAMATGIVLGCLLRRSARHKRESAC